MSYYIQGAILVEDRFESVEECIRKHPGIQIQYIDGDIYLGDCTECGDPVVDDPTVINRWIASKGYYHNNCLSKGDKKNVQKKN